MTPTETANCTRALAHVARAFHRPDRVTRPGAWRHWADQLRLLGAARAIRLALRLAPEGHPDSLAIEAAALVVVARAPAMVDWRSSGKRSGEVAQ